MWSGAEERMPERFREVCQHCYDKPHAELQWSKDPFIVALKMMQYYRSCVCLSKLCRRILLSTTAHAATLLQNWTCRQRRSKMQFIHGDDLHYGKCRIKRFSELAPYYGLKVNKLASADYVTTILFLPWLWRVYKLDIRNTLKLVDCSFKCPDICKYNYKYLTSNNLYQ